MPTTHLTPLAVHGVPQAFALKGDTAGRPEGRWTALSPFGVAGIPQVFLPKMPAVMRLTQLSPVGVASVPQEFTPKAAA
jgi:hypothetical protein